MVDTISTFAVGRRPGQLGAKSSRKSVRMAGGKNGFGFIGLGVMGEPMCRHLAVKGGGEVTAFDLAPEPLERLAAHGVKAAGSAAEVVRAADVIFVSLPSGKHLDALCRGE